MSLGTRVASLRRRLAAFLRRVAARIDAPLVPEHARFRVVQKAEGRVTFAYRGNDGAQARRAWESLVADPSNVGVLWFLDGEDCRGEVRR